jgi:tetratricopeptide (TPR) repeat protein
MRIPRAGLLVFVFLLAASVQVPVAAGQAPRGFPRIPLGKLVVRVRDANGVLLRGQAMVRLYSEFTTLQNTAPTRENGEATFDHIPPGNYRVEVTAPGYQTANVEAWAESGAPSTVYVNLTPESAAAAAPIPAGRPALARKARKKLEKGLQALQANDLKEAQKHLREALKLAPDHPDVNYLVGVLCLQLGELEPAKLHLEKTATLVPDHTAALTALGTVLFRLRDYPAAIGSFERALAVNPHLWQGHWMLAEAYYFERQFEKARAHAERVRELAGAKAPEVQLLLGQTLAALGQRTRAAEEVESFLRRYPEHKGAAAARRILERLRTQGTDSEEAASLAGRTDWKPAVDAAATSLAQSPTAAWAPPNVDEQAPPVATDVSCALGEVTAAAGRRASELVETLQRFTATERVESAKLDMAGNIQFTETQAFNYTVFIREIRDRALAVREFREGSMSLAWFPTQTTGLAAFGLIFHPYYSEDFTMRCEGLGQLGAQPVWQVYFRQREDRPARIHVYKSGSNTFPMKLKGRAWIAANSYHIQRLETDLVEPIEKINLNRAHLAIEYRPVPFAQRNVTLWLPASAEFYLHLRGRLYLHRQNYGDFRLFAVDVKEQIQPPSQTSVLAPKPPSH